MPDRLGHQHAGDSGDRRQHANRAVRLDRDERPGAYLTAVARRGQQHRLGDRRVPHVSQAHQLAGLDAECVDPAQQSEVTCQLPVRLVPGQAEGAGQGQRHRHAVVHAGDVDSVDDIPGVTGEQGPWPIPRCR